MSLCYVCQSDFRFWRRAIIVCCINAVTRPYLNTLLYESRCKLCKLSQEDVGSAYEDVSLWWNVLFVTSWRKSIKCLDFLFLRLLRRFFRFLSPITLPGMGCVMSWATQKEDTGDAIIVISSRYVTSKSEIFWVYIKFPNYNQNYVEYVSSVQNLPPSE